mgnify:CR=1 FL=1
MTKEIQPDLVTMRRPPPLYLASDSAVVEHVPILVHADGAPPPLHLASGGAVVEQVPMLVQENV